MAGDPNPIEEIVGFTSTDDVPKADIVAWAKAHVPQRLADAADIQSRDLSGQLMVQLGSTGRVYALDTSDTTTADDGENCIRDANGFGFFLQEIEGVDGAAGRDAGFNYKWNSSTTDADPGTGKFLIVSGGAQLNISETDDEGHALSSILATWDDGTSTIRGTILAFKSGGTALKVISITGTLTDSGAYDKFACSVTTVGSFSNGDECYLLFLAKGDKGDTGATGATGSGGATGATGPAAAVQFNFSTTTADADPGSGIFRLNNATAASATAAYFDNNEKGGTSISAWLDTFDDSGNSTLRGYLFLFDPATPATFYVFSVSGSVVDGTGYRKVTIAYVAGQGTLPNAGAVAVSFYARGPAGSGDLTSTNNLSDLASPKTGFDTISVHGSDVASASTVDLDAAGGVLLDITGTTTITAVTLSNGRERVVRFTGALTLTHGASLLLPGALNIVTAAGDFAIFRGYGSGVVRCVDYIRVSGHPLTDGAATVASASTADLGGSLAKSITISGTTTITSFGSTAPTGTVKFVEFSGALTLTHNGTSLILPGAANIVTVAGDCLAARHEGSGNWRVLYYTRGARVPSLESFGIALSDETTAITTGTNKATWSFPYAITIVGLPYATLNTVSSSGIPTVDINEGGTTILSTKLTIDASEKTSGTAATPAVVSDADIAANAEIGFDIDVAGTGAKGLKVYFDYIRR